MDADDLSLKSTCTAACCKSGTAYVLPEERNAIVEATGKDYCVLGPTEGPEHYIFGKNKDGTERDLDNEPCPHLTDDDLCELHDLGLKPIDCQAYPIYVDPDNGSVYRSRTCEDCIPDPQPFAGLVRELMKDVPADHQRTIIETNSGDTYGFDLVEICKGE